MNRQEQLDLLTEHYSHPCCRERLGGADVAIPGGNPGCGDVVTIYLKVSQPSSGEGRRHIERATFLGSGCTISQAAASMLMEEVNESHPTLDEVLEMDYEDMLQMLGREVVESRTRCATLALGTLKAAVQRYERQQEMRAAGVAVEESETVPS